MYGCSVMERIYDINGVVYNIDARREWYLQHIALLNVEEHNFSIVEITNCILLTIIVICMNLYTSILAAECSQDKFMFWHISCSWYSRFPFFTNVHQLNSSNFGVHHQVKAPEV